ncbi:MAG: hypothetical protein EBU84_22330, partial [Actinobacteria bacterium]|nr:hypothetical protein [Actinomycetota bacterium]
MTDVKKFPSERIGVKLIPAVCAGETWEESIQRLASIFKAFNTTSEPVTKGSMVAMDMEDGLAIVARAAFRESILLRDFIDSRGNRKRPARVSPSHNTIAKKSTVLTTLATMKQMAYDYFIDNSNFSGWYQKIGRNSMGQPPSQEAVIEATKQFLELWSCIAMLPSMISIEEWEYLPADIQKDL